jgi:hypothetical protein
LTEIKIMKYIITEEQFEKVKDEILKIPFAAFGEDWFVLQDFLKRRGYPPYIITDDVELRDNEEIRSLGNLISVEGNLDLRRSSIISLGNLTSVGGYLDLVDSKIESLGNLTTVGDALDISGTKITSLGNLTYVGDFLEISDTSIESLGNLKEVGSDLYAMNTPLQSFGELVTVGGGLQLKGDFIRKKYSQKKIRSMINILGDINFFK